MESKNETQLQEEIFNRLKRIIIELLKVSQNRNTLQSPEITLNTDLIEDLGLDSIELMDFASAITEEFKVNPKDEMANLSKVADVVKYIMQLKVK